MFVNMLVLNLRSPHSHRGNSRTRTILPERKYAQNRFLGNIGAPVESEQWDEDFSTAEEEINNDVNMDGSVCEQNPAMTMIPVVSHSPRTSTLSKIVPDILNLKRFTERVVQRLRWLPFAVPRTRSHNSLPIHITIIVHFSKVCLILKLLYECVLLYCSTFLCLAHLRWPEWPIMFTQASLFRYSKR